MKSMRVGVVGVGSMGERHCRVLQSLRGVELAGIYDRCPERALEVAARYETIPFPTLEDLAARVEAAIVATPTPTHTEIALELIERGVAVLIEKPMATSVVEAMAICEAARRHGVPVQVGHIERFNPVYIELKAILETMHPISLIFRRLSPYAVSNRDADVILDLMIHDLDLAIDLIGAGPTRIYPIGRPVFSDAMDYAVLTMEFPGGEVATLFASRVTEQKIRAIEITAAEAYIEADLLNKGITIYRYTIPTFTNDSQPVKYRQEGWMERIGIPMAEPLALELQHFVDCVRSGQPPAVSALDGLRAIQLAERIRLLLYSGPIPAIRLDRIPAPAGARP
ncbi:MAG: Gfo/Idh/MocA family oxidoreductase [Thermoflexus sp.]|uniref:Gfo/Idh/MocA family protein n=1 Tax=Thermoflexus sp. TaxID=1969742 RepID=UPI0025CC2513|nr:Gfo/Idh/MocA family oxidoreductase [Thermoflexus sp.]MCS6964652.1 Gfo/Idh/MocA family oxidoreductase [Thermoflexus sp.]MDW8184197.1 Gfo/Idh/MocA family oxidoreductase [Anaerolineae bacterium]